MGGQRLELVGRRAEGEPGNAGDGGGRLAGRRVHGALGPYGAVAFEGYGMASSGGNRRDA